MKKRELTFFDDANLNLYAKKQLEKKPDGSASRKNICISPFTIAEEFKNGK